MYVRDVAIVGDSFPNRLLRDLEKQNKDRNLDLHPYEQANVRWYTKGGLTLSKLRSMRSWVMRDMQEIAILHIGSNDLCTMPVDAFLRQLSKETIPMLRELDFRVILVTQIFRRRAGHFTRDLDIIQYNLKVDAANRALSSLGIHNVIFWDHIQVLRSGSVNKIWHPDGVHLDSSGMHVYWRSIRGAIITTLKSLDR